MIKNFGRTSLILILSVFILNGISLAKKPGISSIRPNHGGPGGILTIYGSDLGQRKGDGAVLFGSIKATVISWSNRSIEAVIPGNVKAVDLKTVGKRRKKRVIPITVKLNSGERLDAPGIIMEPEIRYMRPDDGGPGETVTIKGKNFGDYIDLGKVLVGTKRVKILKWKRKMIVFKLPDEIKPVDVRTEKKRGKPKKYIEIYVKVGNLKSVGKPFYWNPTIRRADTKRASLGEMVTISGRNFGNNPSAVSMTAGSKKIDVKGVTGDSLTFLVPYDLKQSDITNGKLKLQLKVGGVKSNTYSLDVAPRIKRISPTSGKGGILNIYGYNFGSSTKKGRVIIKTGDSKKTHQASVRNWDDEKITVDFPKSIKRKTEPVDCEVHILVGNIASNNVIYTLQAVEKKMESDKGKDK